MSEEINNVFNWNIYEDGYKGETKLVPNKSINGSNEKNKCFSREPYAQKLFDIYTNQNSDVVKKDLKVGDVVRIIDVFNIKEDYLDVELAGGLSVTIDLAREKKFFQVYGFSAVKEFTESLKNKDFKQSFLEKGINVYILETTPSIKISLWQGHLKSVRDEFMKQIENPTQAYTAKILEANRGGFFVEVQGIEAFMPGSLAAPNKIIDFQSYIGKEVVVMIEDFLKEMNSFIVSHKKYLSHALPALISKLDLTKKYSGEVTGCSKFGIFLEFEELFTGLLHTSKMNEETKLEFNKRNVLAGNKLDFYIFEITKDNRIILTQESPEEKLNKIQNFILQSKDKVIETNVAAIMNFGIIVNYGEINGLIPSKEFKKNKMMINNFITGDKINAIFDEFKDDRIIFKLPRKE